MAMQSDVWSVSIYGNEVAVAVRSLSRSDRQVLGSISWLKANHPVNFQVIATYIHHFEQKKQEYF